MDEVIVCMCGSDKWIIGTSGVRCAKCCIWLDKDDVQADVCDVNRKMKVNPNNPYMTRSKGKPARERTNETE